MRYLYLLSIIVCLPANAQNQPVALPSRKLGIQPLQLLLREAVLSYEWPVGKRMGLQVAVGYRYRNPRASPEMALGTGATVSYESSYMLNPHHQAIKLAAGPVIYLNDKRSMYLQAEYFFRHWWLDNTRIVVNSDRVAYSFDAYRTERINVYGAKVLLGVLGVFGRSVGTRPATYSPYLGVGFRVKTYWYESRQGVVGGKPVDYQLEQGAIALPTLHAGVLVTLGFRK
ncbi:hypothetical protein ACAW74_03975 [Fibrella sp. WM1]|uniref:hypothetical protein n=1 Tax=Fibrella musci TaxID=3242485 RepID=UPI00352105E5